MKPLIIVNQNETIKSAVDMMIEIKEKKKNALKELEKSFHTEMREQWDKIENELEVLNLVQKDKDGKYPSLTLRDNSLIGLIEPEDEESPFNKLARFFEK